MNKMNEPGRALELNWLNLSTVQDLNPDDPKEAGIYFWGSMIDNTFVPYYIGMADHLRFRILEHVGSIIGGRYTIYHKDSLSNYRDYNNKRDPTGRSLGVIYSPDWPNSLKEFLKDRKRLQPHIDFMVDTFTFSYAILDRSLVSRQDLKEIEKTCINQFGKENLANTRSGLSGNIIITHIGDNKIVRLFNQKSL